MEQKSWFSTLLKMTPTENLLTTYLTSVMSLLQQRMVEEQLEIAKKGKQAPKRDRFGRDIKPRGKVVKCSKMVELKLCAAQRSIMRQWFGAYRWIYNQCVDFSKRFPHLRKKSRLRSLLVFNYSLWAQHEPWLKDIPAEIRDAACMDYDKAIGSNWAKKLKNPSHTFQFKFKSLKASSASMQLRTRDIIGSGKKGRPRPFPWRWGKTPFKTTEPLEYVDSATRIVYKSGNGKYYTTISRDVACESRRIRSWCVYFSSSVWN
eukprot:NODE_161_length_16629_cov_0.427344.p6 type:complete len:261 gc:universal NODE_161_length_16629_cov_0.427344:7315-6533(-)